ncbi:MAG TPA: aspartate/glutamate racemase family protein [Polyangiaceae bacterium]
MIGLVDWGVGGLGVARLLRAPVLYLSDTGAPPYGTLSPKALEARLRKAVSFLRDRGATKIIFACNAASTALSRLSDLEDVSGVILPTIDLVVRSRAKKVAIVGGKRTILSRAYASALRARGTEVVQKIAQPLSGMIERGEQSTPAFARTVRTILRGTHDCDALVLACTHYPAATPVFEAAFEGNVIDPLPAIAKSIDAKPSRAASTFFTTGDPRAMTNGARSAWGPSFAKLEPARVRL